MVANPEKCSFYKILANPACLLSSACKFHSFVFVGLRHSYRKQAATLFVGSLTVEFPSELCVMESFCARGVLYERGGAALGVGG